jgi:hypothetical protein
MILFETMRSLDLDRSVFDSKTYELSAAFERAWTFVESDGCRRGNPNSRVG